MFYSRPELPQLGFDLIYAGPIDRPNFQFSAETSGHTWIDVHYRSGRLRVWHRPKGIDPHMGVRLIEERHMGPPDHMAITLADVCDLTGMTINGHRVSLDPEKRRKLREQQLILDWSGRTTYFQRELRFTENEWPRFVGVVLNAFPNAEPFTFEGDSESAAQNRRFKPSPSLSECPNGIHIGIEPRGDLSTLAGQDHVHLHEVKAAFRHLIKLNVRRPKVPGSAARHRETTTAFSQIEFTDIISGSIATERENGEASNDQYIEKLLPIINDYFHDTVTEVDLQTHEIRGPIAPGVYFSAGLREWCTDPNRYLFAAYTSAMDEKYGIFGYKAV